jgi:dTDP-4-amino-4,6-dideoxygalactose transaminase
MTVATKKTSDFRYDTGEARVPWATVGEKVNVNDIEEVIKFLIPGGDDSQVYNKQFSRVKDEIKKLWEKGSWATKLTVGGRVEELEEEVKKLLAVKYACFVTNATAGFEIAHKFFGLKKDDEVIAPAITFLSTISYPLEVGAKVVIADIDPRTLNIDPNNIARKITKKTRVIIPVYIGGYPPDMDSIMEIARENNIFVLEDAAHAFGGSYKGKMSGTIGHYGSFSFHEVKNINSLGEGGIVVTNEPEGKDFAKSRFGGFDGSNPIPLWL